MGNTEMLLLVDDHQPEPLELDAPGKQGMGADDDVDGAGGEAFLGPLCLGGRDQSRQAADIERIAVEAFDEVRIMLAREQGGGTDQSDLATGHRHDEGGAQRDLGLAEADIAANQPVHRLAGLEIPEDIGDRAVLVVGFLIGEAVDELRIAAVGLGNDAGPRRALRRNLDELAGDLADALLHPRLAPLPGLPAETVEADAFAVAAVAAQQFDVLDRHIELVAARIFERDAVVRDLAHRDLREALVAADAVVGVDDEIARRQRRQLGEERIGGLALPAAAHQPIAEHVLLGEDGDLGRGEAMVER